MNQLFGSLWTQSATADESLAELETRMQKTMDHRARRWQRMEATLLKEWEKTP
jgi:hypothetical protein